MFQPASERPGKPLIIGGAVAGVILVAVIALLLHGHGGGTAGSGDGSTVTTVLKGSFGKSTMSCPPDNKETRGDTCVVDLDLPAGHTKIVATWTGPALLAMGVRDPARKDVGPQITGEKNHATFTTPQIAAGTYELRVVNVTHPGDFTFTITVTSN